MENFKVSWKLPLADPLLKRGLSAARKNLKVLKKETKKEDLKVLKNKILVTPKLYLWGLTHPHCHKPAEADP